MIFMHLNIFQQIVEITENVHKGIQLNKLEKFNSRASCVTKAISLLGIIYTNEETSNKIIQISKLRINFVSPNFLLKHNTNI